jgi:osmotically-inducible protein OsmY
MKSTRSIYSVVTFIFVAAITGCASRVACPDSECAADKDTNAAVNASLSTHAEFGPPGQIYASTVNHVVYLYGILYTGLQRSDAEIVAADTDGVAKLVDSIAVAQ